VAAPPSSGCRWQHAGGHPDRGAHHRDNLIRWGRADTTTDRGRYLPLAAAVAVAGCYHGTARAILPSDLTRDRGWVLVTAFTLIRQTGERDAGLPALVMMLQRWSVPSSVDEILRSIPVESGHGIGLGVVARFCPRKGPARIRDSRASWPIWSTRWG